MRDTSESVEMKLPKDVLDTTGASPQTGKQGVEGFAIAADAVLDTSDSSPQTGKVSLPSLDTAAADFDLPSNVLDTTHAGPQTGKVSLPAGILDTTAASPQVSKSSAGR